MRNFFVLLTLLAAVVAVPTFDTSAENAATVQTKQRLKNLVPNFSTGRVALLQAIEAQRSRADSVAHPNVVRTDKSGAGPHVNKQQMALISSLSGSVRTAHKHKSMLSMALRKALFKTPKIDRTSDSKQPVLLTASREGLTGDSCSFSTECGGNRLCEELDSDSLCGGGTQCICIPQDPIECTSDGDCPPGEGCTDLQSGESACYSIAAGGGGGGSGDSSGSSSGGSGGGGPGGPGSVKSKGAACVDARALSHLSEAELVFEQHTMADVLCDSDESCATAGHIVAYKGTAMMMSSYCAIVGCSKQRMLVNSPSYRRGMRVASKTKDLDFTAFAACYNTRAEEVFLTAAVHIGL